MIPKVSILIPLYNSEEFIAETLLSAINQTWENKEIIIVDDGSTDKSYEIAKNFKSDKLKIFYQDNKGACAARNLAFEKSTGDFIQYLDADDLLPSDKIEKQLALLSANDNETILTCSWSHFRNDVSEARFQDLPVYKNYEKPSGLLLDMILYSVMLTNNVWLTPRNIIEKAGPWNEDLLINQDGEFFARVIIIGKNIKYCPEVMVLYRQASNNSITRSKKNMDKAMSALNAINLIGEQLMNIDTDHTMKKKAYATLLYRFIYEHVGFYNDPVKQAKNKVKELNVSSKDARHPARIKKMAALLGYWNTIRLLSVFRQIKD